MAPAAFGGMLQWKMKCPQHSYRDAVLEPAGGSSAEGRTPFSGQTWGCRKRHPASGRMTIADVIAAGGEAKVQSGLC